MDRFRNLKVSMLAKQEIKLAFMDLRKSLERMNGVTSHDSHFAAACRVENLQIVSYSIGPICTLITATVGQ